MAFSILTNLAGYTASSIDAAGLTAGTASGYSVNDFISGPRSTRHRTSDSASEIGRGYVFAADTTCSFLYISRADWLLTKNGTRVRPRQRNSGGTWAYIAGVDYNPLASTDLIGPRTQDLLVAVSPADLRGFGLSTAVVSATQATQLSKFWGCDSFSFNVEPEVSINWQPLPDYSYFTPLNGTLPYEIERRFTLSFSAVTRAKATAFKALSNLLQWPVLLYDSTGDIWAHKLEQVLIEKITERVAETNLHFFNLSCLRLKHYD